LKQFLVAWLQMGCSASAPSQTIFSGQPVHGDLRHKTILEGSAKPAHVRALEDSFDSKVRHDARRHLQAELRLARQVRLGRLPPHVIGRLSEERLQEQGHRKQGLAARLSIEESEATPRTYSTFEDEQFELDLEMAEAVAAEIEDEMAC
jgi:hypothetical protein